MIDLFIAGIISLFNLGKKVIHVVLTSSHPHFPPKEFDNIFKTVCTHVHMCKLSTSRMFPTFIQIRTIGPYVNILDKSVIHQNLLLEGSFPQKSWF